MIKIITILSVLICCFIIVSRAYSESNIYTPEYKIISQYNNIEIRQYDKINVITTTEMLPYKEATYTGFRTLAGYIFGNNKENVTIPMTSPVITTLPNEKNIDINFVVNKDYVLNELPDPITNKITFDELELGIVATIKFGFWATPKRIKKYKRKLETYLNNNSIKYSSKFFVAQYNSPWVMPPFRKNELIVSIKESKRPRRL